MMMSSQDSAIRMTPQHPIPSPSDPSANKNQQRTHSLSCSYPRSVCTFRKRGPEAGNCLRLRMEFTHVTGGNWDAATAARAQGQLETLIAGNIICSIGFGVHNAGKCAAWCTRGGENENFTKACRVRCLRKKTPSNSLLHHMHRTNEHNLPSVLSILLLLDSTSFFWRCPQIFYTSSSRRFAHPGNRNTFFGADDAHRKQKHLIWYSRTHNATLKANDKHLMNILQT